MEEKGFIKKHSTYFSYLWGISFIISIPLAIIDRIGGLFSSAQDGNIIGFLIQLVFFSFLVMISTLLGALVIFIILFLVSVIPYLIIRGLRK